MDLLLLKCSVVRYRVTRLSATRRISRSAAPTPTACHKRSREGGFRKSKAADAAACPWLGSFPKVLVLGPAKAQPILRKTFRPVIRLRPASARHATRRNPLRSGEARARLVSPNFEAALTPPLPPSATAPKRLLKAPSPSPRPSPVTASDTLTHSTPYALPKASDRLRTMGSAFPRSDTWLTPLSQMYQGLFGWR